METAGQNAEQVMEENDALKQLIELLNQQNMKEQSQDFMGVFWYVAGMQVQLAAMVDELQVSGSSFRRCRRNSRSPLRRTLWRKYPTFRRKLQACRNA